MRLDGKTALITGAARGIGAEIARTFHGVGARVCIADVDAAGANNLAAELGGMERGALGIAMDVTSESSVEAGIARAAHDLGAIDVLVSNAGIQHLAPIESAAFADWRRMMAIHLDGAFLTTRACLRLMHSQGRGGSIIYMGSVHSKEASVQKGPYVVAKHGLLGLARVVAKEAASFGVRANVICPGFVRTPLVEQQIPVLAKELGISEEEVVRDVLLRPTVDGEFTLTSDVAEVALFLAAFPTNALTGQSITVSHGWHMS